MTTFEKVISVTFSVIVLILSVILMLTVGGVIPPDFGANTMEAIVEGNFFSKILFIVALVSVSKSPTLLLDELIVKL